MGHQLDDFLKKKLEQRQFEFDEAHWADALELIEADDKNNRRRLFWWLCLGTILFLGGVGVGTSSWWKQQYPALTQHLSTENKSRIAKRTIISSPSETHTNTPTNNTKTASNNAPNSIISQNTATTTDTSNFETPKHTRNHRFSASHLTQKGSTMIPPQKSDNAVPTTSTKTKLPIPVTKDSSTPNQTESDIEATHKPSPIHTHDWTARTDQSPDKPLVQPFRLLEQNVSLSNENLKQLMQGDDRFPDLQLPSKASTPFSWGLRASSLLYLAADGQLGYTLGLTGRYQLHSNWAIGADVLYHVRRHQFEPTAQNTIIEYSFGRLERNELLRPSALHSIEVPLYVEYGFGKNKQQYPTTDVSNTTNYHKHRIEIGAAPTFLYGVRGELADSRTDEVLQKGWVDASAYRSFYVNAMIGYNFYPTDFFAIGIRTRYAIGGIIDTNFEFPVGVDSTQPDRLYFDINAKFYLF